MQIQKLCGLFALSAGLSIAVVTGPAQIAGYLDLSIGKAAAQSCHPSYEGACVPNVSSDVDCASGRGNGPYYVVGPVRVVGRDVYGLDRDKDGIGCENG